jgi:hypothetical protein
MKSTLITLICLKLWPIVNKFDFHFNLQMTIFVKLVRHCLSVY